MDIRALVIVDGYEHKFVYIFSFHFTRCVYFNVVQLIYRLFTSTSPSNERSKCAAKREREKYHMETHQLKKINCSIEKLEPPMLI